MRTAALTARVYEARNVVVTLRGELSPATVGPVVVSGMLAEQLAKELAAGAEPGAVVAQEGASTPSAEVLVRIVAGDPSDADGAFVRAADRRGTSVVLVQLWPQADWTPTFVLSPFVVECRAGEGFPLREIADRIVEASEHGPLLAARIPALKEATSDGLVRGSVLRAAILAVAGPRKATRPLITLEQLRMLARLRTATTGSWPPDELPVMAGGAAIALAAGFAFRRVARRAQEVLPAPIANAAVAAAGTWALARVLQTLEARLAPE